jgi:manganese/zinc/iron transport system substrate-binding protein
MRSLLICLAAVCLFVAGCKKSDGRPARPDLANRKAKILATTGMIADAARAVGGEYVEVDCLMGPGVDPHLFVASPRDLARIESADLVLYNGLHLEGKMTDLFEQRSKTTWTVGVAEGLPDLLDAEEGFEGTHDPHVWFDVRLWMKVVEKVRDTLADLDPAHAEQYRANAGKYLTELEELDRQVREDVARIPSDRRVLISAHDAFRYFGRAYGFEVRGLQGVSTAGDTSVRDVQELADLIGSRRIKAVFAETSVSDKGMQAVRSAVRQKYKGFDVRISDEQLYSDALGEPGSPGATYPGMVRHNVGAIARALAD